MRHWLCHVLQLSDFVSRSVNVECCCRLRKKKKNTAEMTKQNVSLSERLEPPRHNPTQYWSRGDSLKAVFPPSEICAHALAFFFFFANSDYRNRRRLYSGEQRSSNRWRSAFRRTERHIFVGTCYSASPRRLEATPKSPRDSSLEHSRALAWHFRPTVVIYELRTMCVRSVIL